MANTNRAILTEGAVGKTLVKLTWPMVFGILGMVTFNLVDTFFVGRLGTLELAALSFTFPVVMVISSLALGLGIGTTSVLSRAIGERDEAKVKRLTTDSLILSFLIVGLFVVIGWLTIEPVFRILGASPEILPLVKQYMRIWYPGMFFVVVPMVGNSAIRATGDTKTPSAIMLVAVTVNLIFDPLFIFGIGPFPRLELAGAALTTVCARATVFFLSMYILVKRERMLTFSLKPLDAVFRSWKQILYIGLPSAGTRMIVPLVVGVIIRIVSAYGPAAVAAYGVSARIEFFALAVVYALASVVGPFIGQNLGAGRLDRVSLGVKQSERFSLLWGFGAFLILAAAARPVASVFNDNPQVIEGIVLYLKIVPLALGLQGIVTISNSALNVLNKPLHAAGLILVQMVLVYIPLAYLGSTLFGLAGVFGALAFVYAAGGICAHLLVKRFVTAQG
jgi:putative MATE family efflux protein